MTNKKLIIFTDSGDTIIDEATQVRDERGIVLKADFIPGAGEVLKQLHDEGFTVALVADGEWESFQNVYRENGLGYCFDAWIVSEVVGKQKPEPIMFETAMKALKLTDEDRSRIVMIGNNSHLQWPTISSRCRLRDICEICLIGSRGKEFLICDGTFNLLDLLSNFAM